MTGQIPVLLLIDDFLADRELYRRYLQSDENSAYQLLEAETAEAGLGLCQVHAVDAILLDYRLPDADGLEFLESLRSQSSGSMPSVVMVTGEGDETVAVQAMKLGAEDYLVKRYLTPERLQLTMRSALDNARVRSQLQRSEARFRASVENMLDCFGLCSAIRSEDGKIVDFRIDYLNAAALESNQMTSADIGRGLCEIYPAHQETGLFAAYCQVVETGEPLTKETLVYTDVFGSERLTRAFDIRVNRLDDGIVLAWRDVTARKQAELELQEKQQFIQQISDAVPGFLYIYDLIEQRNIYSNRGIIDILGYSPEEIQSMGENVLPQLFHPEDFAEVPARIARLCMARPGENFESEFRLRHADGQWRWFCARETPYARNGEGVVHQILGVAQEITERKQVEVLLRESQQRYQQLAEAMPQMVWTADAAGIVNYWNQQWYEYTGLTPTQSLGLAGVGVVHPEDRDRTLTQWQQAVANQKPFEIEHRIRRQDGVYHWFINRGTLTRDSQDQVTGWIGTVTDIDELKRSQTEREQLLQQLAEDVAARQQTEAALRDNEQQLKAIIDNSRAAIFLKDTQGRYLLMNHECEQVCQVTNDWVRGKTDYDLFPPEVAAALWANDQTVLRTGKALTLEEAVPLEDGVHTYLTVKFPLFHGDGVPYALCGISTDITERVRLQGERDRLLAVAEAARAEAEAANRSKDDFISLVAHELRSPLNAILGWAKLLQTRPFDAATTQKALDTIIRNTRAQVQLIEDLLDVSRMARGELRLEFAVVDLGDVVEAASETIRPNAEAKGLEVNLHLQPVPSVQGDASRLQQVVLNLLTNAIKFTPEGGQVQVQLEQEASQVCLRIRDTGQGISPDFLPHIFERFRQDQKNTTTKQGLGLGLALVQYIVEQHGGTVTAQSQGSDQGTTFTVRLPIAPIHGVGDLT